jgi:hypothetical protein
MPRWVDEDRVDRIVGSLFAWAWNPRCSVPVTRRFKVAATLAAREETR